MFIKAISFKLYKKAVRLLAGTGIGKNYFIRSVSLFLRSKTIPEFIEIDGNKMFLDKKDFLDLSLNGVYEKFETECVKKIIKKGDVVLDIGANIGYYTLIFAKLVGEKGKVFAFEPEPDNFAILKKNVQVNSYKNVVLVQKALSDEMGRAKLYLADENKGDHRIFDSGDERIAIEIDVIRLDDYFKDFDGIINFIKMDVQGTEHKVIKGMPLLLSKLTNLTIMAEFEPRLIKRSGEDPIEYLNLLLQFGFKLFNANTKENRIDAVDSPKLLSLHPSEVQELTNLFCVKGNSSLIK